MYDVLAFLGVTVGMALLVLPLPLPGLWDRPRNEK